MYNLYILKTSELYILKWWILWFVSYILIKIIVEFFNKSKLLLVRILSLHLYLFINVNNVQKTLKEKKN